MDLFRGQPSLVQSDQAVIKSGWILRFDLNFMICRRFVTDQQTSRLPRPVNGPVSQPVMSLNFGTYLKLQTPANTWGFEVYKSTPKFRFLFHTL